MKRISIFFGLAAIIGMVLLSCEKETLLIVNQNTISFGREGGNVSLPFIANKTWMASSDQSWCKVLTTGGDASGDNNVTLTIYCDPNTEYDDRSCTLTIACMELSQTIRVTQSQQNGLFVLTPEYSLSNEYHLLTVEIMSNVTYSTHSEADWIKVVSSRGLQTSQLTLEVAANTTMDRREGRVSLRQTNGNMNGVITIVQDAGNGLVVSQNSYNLSSEAHTIDIEVKYNIDFEVVIPLGCNDWIKKVETKGGETKVFTFAIGQNDTYGERDGSITFKQKEGPLSETVTIHQDQNDAIVLDQREYRLSGESQSLTIDVMKNVKFKVETSEEWIKYADTKSLSDQRLVFEIQENSGPTMRQGTISLIADNLRQSILVIQKSNQYKPSNAKEPQFKESIELVSLVWRMAGANEYNECGVPEVYESADKYFAPMMNHEAVSYARECNRTNVFYDAVVDFGLHLLISEEGQLSFDPFYLEGGDSNFDRWTSYQRDKMLPLLNDFYQKSHFHEWYQSLEPLRQEAVKIFNTAGYVDYEWFDSFFGPREDLSFQILLSFLVGPYNYGLSARLASGGELLTPVIGNYRVDKAGKLYYNDDGSVLIHEFCHPYCNPLIAKYWRLISDKAEDVYFTVNQQMMSMAYSNAQSMMNESFVRASVIRYFTTHKGRQDRNTRIREEEDRGFVLMRTMVDALEQRELQPSRYPDMDSFMPDLMEAVNGFGQFKGTGQYDEYTNPSVPNLLPGIFSVSPTKQVRFTKGNLYWNGQEWRFEPNQMNYPAAWDPGHVGHFYWTKTDAAAYTSIYGETGTQPTDLFFCDGSDDSHLLTVEGIPRLRVLADDATRGEIGYLIFFRENSERLARFPVEIKDVGRCLVIAPDNFTGTIKDSYDANTWAVAEQDGLVCFTPSGFRDDTDVMDTNGFLGAYWSGSPKKETNGHGYMLLFDTNLCHYPTYSSRRMGFSIRLVQDVTE